MTYRHPHECNRRIDADVVGPLQDGAAGHLDPIVGDDHRLLAAAKDPGVLLAQNADNLRLIEPARVGFAGLRLMSVS